MAIVREYQEYTDSVPGVLREALQALQTTSRRLDQGEVALKSDAISKAARQLRDECDKWLRDRGADQVREQRLAFEREQGKR